MESLIGYHCAPALAGIKASNIVTCCKDKGYNVDDEIKRLNRELNIRNIYLEPLCECEKRVLVMVYRKNVLSKILSRSEERKFLTSMGYPLSDDVEVLIDFLKSRFTDGEFPHEIGVFLGYPMHDVYGFINHKNEGCLLCGDWKVYKNAEEAQKLFKRFSDCRKALINRIMRGDTLYRVFCMT